MATDEQLDELLGPRPADTKWLEASDELCPPAAVYFESQRKLIAVFLVLTSSAQSIDGARELIRAVLKAHRPEPEEAAASDEPSLVETIRPLMPTVGERMFCR